MLKEYMPHPYPVRIIFGTSIIKYRMSHDILFRLNLYLNLIL